MLKKVILTASITFMCLSGFAQKSINNFKYILVPKQFEFSKTDDEYQLNSLTKFLFNKYGYEAYFSDEVLPDDLIIDGCLGLTVDVSNNKSGIFTTKLIITLKDCVGKVVQVSEVGESRLKKFDKAYNQALRAAFETFKNMDYSYRPTTVTSDSSEKRKIPYTIEVIEPEEEVPTDLIKETNGQKVNESLYYAQVVKDGYQLVDAEPKIIMVLIKTDAKNVFIVKDRSAIVYKENNRWVYYENNNGSITTYSMNIKF